MEFNTDRARLTTSSTPPVELTSILLFVLVSSVWASLVRDAVLPFIYRSLPIYFGATGDFVMYVLGVGGAAVVYLRARGLSVGVGVPHLSPTGLACVLAPAAALVVSVPVGMLFGVDVLRLFAIGYVPGLSPGYYMLNITVSAVSFAVAQALLVCGVIYETLRHHVSVSNRDATVLTALLAGVIHTFPVSAEFVNTLFRGPLNETVPTTLALSVIAITAAICVATSLGIVYQAYVARDLSHAVSLWYGPVYAFAVVGLSFLVIDLHSFYEELLYALVAILSLVGYNRTGSIWVAVATVGLFESSIGLASVLF